MTSTAAPAAPSGTAMSAAEAVAAEVAGMLARLGELTDTATADGIEGDRTVDAARIDAIRLLERVQAAAAATQAAVMVRFARSQVTTQKQALLDGRDPRKLECGIGDQLGLACRAGPAP